jgi:hypothetical protein
MLEEPSDGVCFEPAWVEFRKNTNTGGLVLAALRPTNCPRFFAPSFSPARDDGAKYDYSKDFCPRGRLAPSPPFAVHVGAAIDDVVCRLEPAA